MIKKFEKVFPSRRYKAYNINFLWGSFVVLWYNSYNVKLFSLENLSSAGCHHIYMKGTRHHQHLDIQYVRLNAAVIKSY